MAIENFENKNIQDTFQRVVQTDGTNQLADGTGSVFIPISSSHAITSSHALFAVSASHEVTFELSSSHAQTADALTPGTDINVRHVTASGDISSSGDIIGSNVYVPTGGEIGLDGEGGNDVIKINSGQIDIFRAGQQKLSIQSKNVVIHNSDLKVNGEITASGNISASAASTIQAGSGSFHVLKGDTTKATGLEVDGFISATHITASGNISASGNIIGIINGGTF
jgi:hypothetical protein